MKKLLGDIECHAIEGISACFSNGIDPNDYFNNSPLIYQLISEYTRTPRFKDGVRAFIAAGLNFPEKELLAVLSDDFHALDKLLEENPAAIKKTYTLRSAYTPLQGATLLHVCAEFNHLACAKVLVNHGADINAAAGRDEYGFGGQTPIFHTVNQNADNSADMMTYLLSTGADLKITVPGLVWGRGYQWETLCPAVNPISYAMMGLLPQMHRDEQRISEIVSRLLKQAYGLDYLSANVPNAYLK